MRTNGRAVKPASIRAVMFDVDGTLYLQRRLRLLMAAELGFLPARLGRAAPRTWRILAAFRAAHEELRREAAADVPLGAVQIRRAAVAAGVDESEAARVVEEWFFYRPLKYLRACRAPGIIELLSVLRKRGIRMGVLSDYDPIAKLGALGLDGWFDPVLCSSAETINALKPHPRGFLVACEALHLDPKAVLYVGDRVDVDAAGARAAGMPCIIMSRGASWPAPAGGAVVMRSFERLARDLDPGR